MLISKIILNNSEALLFKEFLKYYKQHKYAMIKKIMADRIKEVNSDKLNDLLFYLELMIDEKKRTLQLTQIIGVPFSVLMIGVFGSLPTEIKENIYPELQIVSIVLMASIGCVFLALNDKSVNRKVYYEMYYDVVKHEVDNRPE